MRKSMGSRKTRLWLSWIAVAAWATVIFYASSNTGGDLNEGSGWFAYVYQILKDMQSGLFGSQIDVITSVAHFCEYALLAALLSNSLRYHLPLRYACMVAVVCASAYGVTDEIHQIFVPGRVCDPTDWVVDTLGAMLGAWIAYGRLCMCKDA